MCRFVGCYLLFLLARRLIQTLVLKGMLITAFFCFCLFGIQGASLPIFPRNTFEQYESMKWFKFSRFLNIYWECPYSVAFSRRIFWFVANVFWLRGWHVHFVLEYAYYAACKIRPYAELEGVVYALTANWYGHTAWLRSSHDLLALWHRASFNVYISGPLLRHQVYSQVAWVLSLLGKRYLD